MCCGWFCPEIRAEFCRDGLVLWWPGQNWPCIGCDAFLLWPSWETGRRAVPADLVVSQCIREIADVECIGGNSVDSYGGSFPRECNNMSNLFRNFAILGIFLYNCSPFTHVKQVICGEWHLIRSVYFGRPSCIKYFLNYFAFSCVVHVRDLSPALLSICRFELSYCRVEYTPYQHSLPCGYGAKAYRPNPDTFSPDTFSKAYWPNPDTFSIQTPTCNM